MDPLKHKPLHLPEIPKQSPFGVIFLVIAWGISLVFAIMIIVPMVTGKTNIKYDQGVVDFYIEQGYNIHCVNERIIAVRAHVEKGVKQHVHVHNHITHGHNVEHPFNENGRAIECSHIEPTRMLPLVPYNNKGK